MAIIKIPTMVCVVGALAVGSAHAALIDFTSDEWSGVSGSNPYSRFVDGVGTVTLSAVGGDMTFNSGLDQFGCDFSSGAASVPLACDGDGIGIVDDEITAGDESLMVSFAPSADVIDIYLLDLYNNSKELEQATIQVTGDGTIYTVTGGSDLGGFIVTGIMQTDVTQIKFTALNNGVSDYALAAIRVGGAALAEPASIALLATGLLGVGMTRSRRKAGT